MPTFFIALSMVVFSGFGLLGVADAQTKDIAPVSAPAALAGQSLNNEKTASSSNDYYFQNWNCLTNL